MREGRPIFDEHALDQYREFWGEEANEVIRELLTMFLEQTPSHMDTLRAAFQVGDLSAVRRVAHTLKSSSGSVGAYALADICQQVEDLALAKDIETLRSLVPRLEEIALATTQVLREYLEHTL